MTYTVPPGRYSDVNSAFVQAYIDAAIAGVVELAPETLNSLNELAAAINDDPAFYATVASQVSELNTDVTALNTALGIAENDSDVGTFSSPTLPDSTTLRAVLEAFASAYDTTKSNLEGADTALSGRIDTLETDPTTATAVSQVQADVDQNELDSDAADLALSNRLDTLETDPTTQTVVDALEIALDTRLDVLEADPTTETALAVERGRIDAILSGADADKDTFAEIVTLINSVDTENDDAFAAYVLSNDAAVAAVQSDVDQNESDSDAADAALSGRLDVLEADPTTATAVAAVQSDVDQNETDSDAADAALSGRLDTLESDPTTQTAVDAKLNIASPAATGTLTVDTNASLKFDSNLTKVENVLRGTSINIGNNIEMRPAAPGGRVEVVGGFHIDITEVPEYSNDSQAAAGGVVVGGIYRSGSVLHIRVS